MTNHLHTRLIPELCCSDIKISLAFYTEVLGFKIEYQREEEGFAMLQREASRIMLDEIAQNPRGMKRIWQSALLEKPFGRGINLQIRTSNIDALYRDVQESSTNIFLAIEEQWYRVNNIEIGHRQFIVLDPDGYMLRFAEDLGSRESIRCQWMSKQ
jgi:catechol 2,3-dioxygenase-like lactoylglutathione lyase family enzyme